MGFFWTWLEVPSDKDFLAYLKVGCDILGIFLRNIYLIGAMDAFTWAFYFEVPSSFVQNVFRSFSGCKIV